METKDGVKLLIKALKEYKPEQAPAVDANHFNLPDLYSSLPTREVPQTSNSPEPSALDLSTQGLGINTDLVNALIGKKGIDLSVNNLPIKGRLNYNGDMSLNASAPLAGGNLSLDANRTNGDNRYYLQYQRQF